LKLAERGGKNGKKRAVVATARKLAVLLHRLWVSGEAYEPLRKSRREMLPGSRIVQVYRIGKLVLIRWVSVTCEWQDSWNQRRLANDTKVTYTKLRCR
jgi:hypothetical protein